MTKMMWTIEWYICHADRSDVEEEAKAAKSEKRAPAFTETGAELWRAAIAIGPITFDHSHWGGIICQLNQAQTEWVAKACEMYEDAGNTFPNEEGGTIHA